MAVKRFSYANTERVRAEARHVRTSARKIRLVLDEIRGRSVVDARARLLFSPRDAAKDVELVLRSAVTNAEVNHGLSPDDLVVDEAYANEGMTIKRFRPRARGRASRINKRTSHVVIVLRSVDGEEIVVTSAATEAPDASRSRRVAASKKQSGVEEASTEAVEEGTDVAAEAEVETAPKPTRSRTKKAETTEDAPAEEKPKRTRAKKAETTEKAPAEEKPNRTRAKKAETAEDAPAEEKPKRTRAKKSETAEAEAGAEEKKPRSRAKKADDAEAPKPTRSRAKKTETDDGEEA